MVKTKKETTLVTTWAEWYEIVGEPDRSRVIALDLETTGLSPWHNSIAVLGLYDVETDTCAALHYPRTDGERMNGAVKKLPPEVVQWLSDERRFFVAHNAIGFDMYFLWNAGVNIFQPKWFDTLVAEGVVIKAARRDVRVNLKMTYKRRLGKDLKKDINHETWQAPVLTREQLEYVMHDIIYLPELMESQLELVAGDSRARAMKLEQELLPVVARMVVNGLPVNKKALQEQMDFLVGKRHEFADACYRLLDNHLINLNSAQQVVAAFAELGTTVPNSTAATVYNIATYGEGKAKEFATNLMQFKKMKSRSGIYKPSFFEDNIIPTRVDDYRGAGHAVHARYWQVGTDTGRFSSSEPNLQQVAADLRTFFGVIPGNACATLDYSQLEVRISAWLAHDEALLNAVDAEDVHTAVAAAIFGVPPEKVEKWQRKLAKAGTFTFLFGGKAKLFYETAISQGSEMTLQEAYEFEETFFQRFTGLAKVRIGANNAAKNRSSVSVVLPHGLIRTLAGATLRPATIMNTAVQGSAASGLKQALLLCKEYGIDQYLAGTVHDEIIFVAPEDLLRREIVPLAEKAMKLGMQMMFPGTVHGKTFPVEVGVTVRDCWDGPPPIDQAYFDALKMPLPTSISTTVRKIGE